MALPIPARLTTADFAHCIQRCDETVRNYIRCNRRGLRRFVDGPPYLIDPQALALFKVDPAMAAARLAENRPQSAPPSEGISACSAGR